MYNCMDKFKSLESWLEAENCVKCDNNIANGCYDTRRYVES